MAKANALKKQKSMEETLWESANKLRGSVESSEYKHEVFKEIFEQAENFKKYRE